MLTNMRLLRILRIGRITRAIRVVRPRVETRFMTVSCQHVVNVQCHIREAGSVMYLQLVRTQIVWLFALMSMMVVGSLRSHPSPLPPLLSSQRSVLASSCGHESHRFHLGHPASRRCRPIILVIIISSSSMVQDSYQRDHHHQYDHHHHHRQQQHRTHGLVMKSCHVISCSVYGRFFSGPPV